jgi:hypothetical protein
MGPGREWHRGRELLPCRGSRDARGRPRHEASRGRVLQRRRSRFTVLLQRRPQLLELQDPCDFRVREQFLRGWRRPRRAPFSHEVHFGLHEGTWHSAFLSGRQRHHGCLCRDPRGGPMDASREWAEHDRGGYLSLVRPGGSCRRENLAGWGAGPTGSYGRRGPPVDLARSDRSIQAVAARERVDY